MASTMVHSPKAMESMGFGSPFARRSRLSLVDAWVSLPSLRPVRTGSNVTTGSMSGSSGTPRTSTPRALYVKSSLSLDVSFSGETEEVDCPREVGCETPKSTDHRIPDVDVDFCPPAPKKARGMSRMALACATECENPSMSQDMGISPCLLF
ncbi:hypothetical protein M758_3G039200 [Ceratodon purpureus]|nr:hypothetical protein M758_3G039200 [Ceratodon purpureus]